MRTTRGFLVTVAGRHASACLKKLWAPDSGQ
jgi:hypothetical protein